MKHLFGLHVFFYCFHLKNKMLSPLQVYHHLSTSIPINNVHCGLYKWKKIPGPYSWEMKPLQDTEESCLFTMCCFSLPPVNRQMAVLLLQGLELPDTLVTARLVRGRFSTLTLGVWCAANVLEGRLTEEEIFLCSLARIKDSQCSAKIDLLGHNYKAFINSQSWVSRQINFGLTYLNLTQIQKNEPYLFVKWFQWPIFFSVNSETEIFFSVVLQMLWLLQI